VYTIGAFKRFQREFTKSMSYTHCLKMNIDNTNCYYVSPTLTEEFGHYVTYDSVTHDASCTCKRYEEGGFLCRHILRIYHCVGCVAEIPPTYILKRWTKHAKIKDDVNEGVRGKTDGPVWRLDMQRKFHTLIVASAGNEMARAVINDCFKRARDEVESIVGGISLSDDEDGEGNESVTTAADVIQNPKGKTKKGERFKRKRSVKDVQASVANGRFKSAETRARKRATTDSRTVPHMGLRQILITPEDYTT